LWKRNAFYRYVNMRKEFGKEDCVEGEGKCSGVPRQTGIIFKIPL
jgi:hypothetical protein